MAEGLTKFHTRRLQIGIDAEPHSRRHRSPERQPRVTWVLWCQLGETVVRRPRGFGWLARVRPDGRRAA